MSSISLVSSPMTCMAPPQQGQPLSSTSTSTSTRGRCAGRAPRLRRRDPGRPRGAAPRSRLLLRRLGGGRGLLEVLQAELQLVGVELLRAPAEPAALQLPDQAAAASRSRLAPRRARSRTRSRSVRAASRSARTVSCSACSDTSEAFCRATTSAICRKCCSSRSGSRGRSSSTSDMALFYWPKAGKPGFPLTRPCSAAAPRGAGAGATASPRAITRRDAPGAEGDLALPDEVEVTDPAHPLHGRRFRLLSASRTVQTAGHVRVEYRPGILLMLPIQATSLRPAAPRPSRPSSASRRSRTWSPPPGRARGHARRAPRGLANPAGGLASGSRRRPRRGPPGGEPWVRSSSSRTTSAAVRWSTSASPPRTRSLTNQESLRLQYALRQRARELGWREADIDVIDADLGLSGAPPRTGRASRSWSRASPWARSG